MVLHEGYPPEGPRRRHGVSSAAWFMGSPTAKPACPKTAQGEARSATWPRAVGERAPYACKYAWRKEMRGMRMVCAGAMDAHDVQDGARDAACVCAVLNHNGAAWAADVGGVIAPKWCANPASPRTTRTHTQRPCGEDARRCALGGVRGGGYVPHEGWGWCVVHKRKWGRALGIR